MTQMKRAALFKMLIGLCAAFLIAEIAYELLEHLREGQSRSYLDMVHLFFEFLSAVFLVIAYNISRKYQIALLRFGEAEHRTLSALRSQFDELIRQRFDDWGLTSSECDVALLSFRGLKISEIAEARGTREGTIKAQLSAVFHKAGVSSKSELLAVFMDLFLDFGTEPEPDGVWMEPIEPTRNEAEPAVISLRGVA
ncbi:MAG: hypothetical protein Q8Q63_07515 [Phaeovulum sp.]|uniref:helix-turn-helix transcriptional regulator n=1 Tax=Phaeovulum sp. TaxID=2934796 RepID=UPI002736C07A|nr:hypothetical protein [Phaeovulum sp.]MDP3861418.1 hypothetical protein [Phaeovulum sp.]